MLSCMDGTGKSWCCLLRKLLAEPFALLLSSSSVHAPSLGLSTACDAVRARQVGWCASEGKQESELLGHGARSQARRCRTCSSHERRLTIHTGACAANSGSEKTSPTVEQALMLKSPPMKSTKMSKKRGRSVAHLGHNIVDMQQSTNDQCRHFPRVLAGRGLSDGEDSGVGLERVFVE